MIERLNRNTVLGTAATVAITAGNLLFAATETSAGEQIAVHGDHPTAKASRRLAPHPNGGTSSDETPTGCTTRDNATVSNGPRSRRLVALTFDDGPSLRRTPKILDILERFDVPATFFVEGQHVSRRESLMREMLAGGHELANHSYTHPKYPGYEELARTNQRIEEATGFRPCHFRPPYGLIDSNVSSAAASLNMDIVLWDDNSGDDKQPGAATIRTKVLRKVHAGSIIMMHDGGRHPQTVAALPDIIDDLQARGFGFATVTDLLGGHFTYK